MYKVLNCLVTEHDLFLVALAAAVCAASAYTAFNVFGSARAAPGPRRFYWFFLTGFVTGAGIWATHFIAMLAYDPGMPAAYEPMITVLSLIIAIVVTTAGFTLMGIRDTVWNVLAGGVVVGLGISAMHYTGMRAFVLPGDIFWNQNMVNVSIALGAAFGAASALAYRSFGGQKGSLYGAGLLTLAICTMHFTAMGSFVVLPDSFRDFQPSLIHDGVMAAAIAGVAALVLLVGLVAARIDTASTQETLTRFQELVEAAIEGIVVARDGEILGVNRQVSELCGFPERELRGKPVFGGLLEGSAAPAKKGETTTVEALMRTASGKEVPVEVVCRPYNSGIRGNEVYAIRDLRERREAEERIHYMAHHDALTDLPNRAMLNDVLEQALFQAAAAEESFAVMWLDLDRFKEINDIFGHAAGDEVLKEVGRRMIALKDEDEFIARVGGDEFVVVQRKTSQPHAAGRLASRLIEALDKSFEFGGQQTGLGVSIGITVYPTDGMTGEQLMANADIALYRAKSGGRGQFRFFEQEMDQAHRRRRKLSRALQAAVENNQLEVHYQPQVRLSDGELIGFEALLRWRHPEHGSIPPSEFIPIAEESGIIIAIGNWVLRAACEEAATWDKPYKVAVNLSPKQFHMPNLVEMVHTTLLETGIPPRRLELEVTETTLFEDQQRALDALRRLKALGVSIAMDDFGTGYSSLSTLQAFPFDKIKIDRSFVSGLGRGREAATIVKSVLGLGKSLDIPVLAEGVETEEQLGFLSREQCHEVQGFYFGKPLSRDETRALLASGGLAAGRDAAAPEERKNLKAVAV